MILDPIFFRLRAVNRGRSLLPHYHSGTGQTSLIRQFTVASIITVVDVQFHDDVSRPTNCPQTAASLPVSIFNAFAM